MTSERRTAAGSGLLWCTAFVLGPYLVAVLTLLAWSWPHDTLPASQCEGIGFGCDLTRRDGALLLTFISAPFAALATGVAWLLVLALRRGPVKRWAGSAQGALSAAMVLLAVAGLLVVQVAA
jgi:hypothetical protein